ncbi:DUF4838 domain-containing protein [Paenibacillus eucommiae]|uniref:DUF4838 domain-containing protein n=1 Tax=Paenibacillus eucommiae TaxID=1355755 RepID=A0ABS4IRF4_9BACL|nr:DUF4838 domain-containing protein [Paenibacillus eucommiae]MBP1990153.1 hypothetical protein [Paenibacillus eucommiae]
MKLTNMQADGIKICEGAQITAVALTAPDANDQIRYAAALLVTYINKSTGGQLFCLSTSDPDIPSDIHRIYIGTYDPAIQTEIRSRLDGLGSDGFIIFPYENSIAIVGNTSGGTEFGVLEFLERYVGVRWLMPGPDGADVPYHTDITIPLVPICDEPASLSRHFFGTESADTSIEWARHNRMQDTIHFHHNMSELFNPQVFQEHPEYYPDGVLPSHPDNWQPCMNDITARVAAQRIITFFEQNPDAISYSLGINDSQIYCEANPDHPLYTGKINSIGYLDLSDVYYPWINKIVESVSEIYPDKYFGLLAYWNVYDPPTKVKLHPRIIPYITDDRMSWIDPVKRLEGHKHTERWKQAAEHLAFYEYLYGSPYCVPRIYNYRMAENYKYAKDANVIAHVAELFPNFGEGPKPWISAKLQWNPEQRVEDLLNEWVVRAVGWKAAPYLLEYYNFWEYFWNTRVFVTEWYRKWADSAVRFNFLDLFDSSYLQAVSDEDLAACRLFMEQVVFHAETEGQKKRALLLMSTFEYYEASTLSYMRDTQTPRPASNEEALAILLENSRTAEIAEKRLQWLKNPPEAMQLMSPNDLFSFEGVWIWRGTERAIASSMAEWLDHSPDPGSFLSQLNMYGGDEEPIAVRNYARLIAAQCNGGLNLIKEGSNYTENITWHWTENPLTQIRTGACLIEEAHLEPGWYGAIIRLNVTEEMDVNATVNWYFHLTNEAGEIVDSVITGRIPLATTKGDLITLETIFEVGVENCKASLAFRVYEIKPGEQLDLAIQDVALYSLNLKLA